MSSSDKDNFQPISNPYIVGNPIKDRKMFFGREDDFAYIRTKVTGGKEGGLLVLCGARRSGKTSILFQSRDGRLGEDFVPVLIDMQSMTMQNEGDFIGRLARDVIYAIDSPEISFEQDFKDKAREDPFTAFEQLKDKISTVLQGKKLILMFDEYEIFEAQIDKKVIGINVLNLLANWMEHKEGVFIIFTGSDKLEARNSRYWDHFLGKALHRRISFLSRKDTLRLINDPVSDKVHYAPDVPDKIYTLTAGQPFYIQVLCQSLIDHLNDNMKYDVGDADVQEAVDEIIENPLPQMIFAWTSLTNLEKLSLSIIAELNKNEIRPVSAKEIVRFPSKEKIGYQLDFNKLNETVEKLFHHDLLDKESDGDRFKFKMDLWRQWIVRMHSTWQVIDEVSGDKKTLGEGIRPDSGKKARVWMYLAAAVLVLAAGALFLLKDYLIPADNAPPVVARADSTTMTIRTEPTAADVTWGGRVLGESPINNMPVPAGRMELTITYPGYWDYGDTLTLLKDVVLDTVIVLKEQTGHLQVVSNPPGARILLDGEDIGQRTNTTIENLSVNRRYRLDLRVSGYNSWFREGVEILVDSIVPINHVFSKKVYSFAVYSTPDKAHVYLGGEMRGTTPCNLSNITGGPHELELRKKGYQPVRETIVVPVPDNMISRNLELLPPGKMVFKIIPYAALFIDDQPIHDNVQNRSVKRPPGVYMIKLVYMGVTYEEEINLKSGQEEVISHNFLTEKEE